jgi:hypothetical protein
MTVRGFLAWYLTTVAMVGVSGAAMWHGIQSRKQLEQVALIAPQTSPAPMVSQTVAEPSPPQATVTQNQSSPPKPPTAAVSPLPALRPAPVDHTTHVASTALSRRYPATRSRPTATVALHPPRYHYPPVVVAQGAEPYPSYPPGPYVAAYPPVAVAPWQVQAYPYYYRYYRYYARYPYYSAYR